MIFIVDYDRRSGELVGLEQFNDWQRLVAQRRRLEIELKHNKSGLVREVVLLEATNKEALQRTHRRYFETASQIADCKSTEVAQ